MYDMNKEKTDLKTAYALKTPQDSIELYGVWAASYDDDFAKANDYQNPRQVADIFAERNSGNFPILDIGAGTGLVGQGLAAHNLAPIDALDISQPMLDVAMGKGCYRTPILADLTQSVDISDNNYGGITSAGTFTHGHVGPDAIDELIRIAKPGALFVLGINGEFYQSRGFEAKFTALVSVIRDFEILTTHGYGSGAPAELQKAKSAVAVFWKR